MMMEQEIVSKNEDLQERWKSTISVVCISAQYVDKAIKAIQDLANRMTEVIRELAERVRYVFSSVSEMLKQCWGYVPTYEDLVTVVKEKRKDNQNYPHGYPPYVHNLKINKQGYHRPIMRCARSRC